MFWWNALFVFVCKSGVDSQDHLWSYGAEIVLCRVVFFACGTDPGSVARAFYVHAFEMCQLGAQFPLTVSSMFTYLELDSTFLSPQCKLFQNLFNLNICFGIRNVLFVL